MAKYLIRRISDATYDVMRHSLACTCKDCTNTIPFKEESINNFSEITTYKIKVSEIWQWI